MFQFLHKFQVYQIKLQFIYIKYYIDNTEEKYYLWWGGDETGGVLVQLGVRMDLDDDTEWVAAAAAFTWVGTKLGGLVGVHVDLGNDVAWLWVSTGLPTAIGCRRGSQRSCGWRSGRQTLWRGGSGLPSGDVALGMGCNRLLRLSVGV